MTRVNPGTTADLLVVSMMIYDYFIGIDIPSLCPFINKQKKEIIMAVVDKVLVGEALVVTEGGDNEISHIDLLMGPRGSAVEDDGNTLCNNKDGFTSLLAVVSPNLTCKPSTAMFNKVTIKGAKQAVQMFGPAQAAVARAVTEWKMEQFQLMKLRIFSYV